MSKPIPRPTDGSEQFRVWLETSQVRSDVARALGVTTQAISFWARGMYRPRQRHLLAIQELAGIPRADWFTPTNAK
jgi:transcriptional regulator with XRE-family HTH domain